jgi:hypothetical protein
MPVDPTVACVVGVEHSTLSGRAVVVRVADGALAATVDPATSAACEEYSALHDYFGRGTNKVMRNLRAIQRRASS